MLEKITDFLLSGDTATLRQWRSFFVRSPQGYKFRLWPAVLSEEEYEALARTVAAALPPSVETRQRNRLLASIEEAERRA